MPQTLEKILERVNKVAKEVGLDAEVVKLAERVFNDASPVFQHAYLFSESKDNEASVFGGAYRLQQEGLASIFFIMGGIEANGFPGYIKWRERAGKTLGYECIKPVYMEDPGKVNTLSEAVALITQTRKDEVTGLHIVSAPFHQLRAMMTLASEIIRQNSPLSVFNYMGDEQPWDEEVVHSQGTLVATRAELMRHEIDRIKSYSAKGDILPVREIRDYMDRRTS